MEVNLYTRFLLFTLKEGREAGLSQRPLTQCSVHNLEYWSFPTGRYYSQNRLWGFCIQKYAEKTISLLLRTEAGWENNFTPFAYRSEQREQFHSFCIQKCADRTILLLLQTDACRENNFTPSAYRSVQKEQFHSCIQKHAERMISLLLHTEACRQSKFTGTLQDRRRRKAILGISVIACAANYAFFFPHSRTKHQLQHIWPYPL